MKSCTCFCRFVYLLACFTPTIEECPKSKGDLHRLGTTRYYVIQGKERGRFVTQEEARHKCKKFGLQLAKIRTLLSMSVVSRELEKLSNQTRWMDTWYWLDAKYDEETEMYYWGERRNNDVVKLTNIFYRPPRPIGIGAYITFNGTYKPEENVDQCLTLAHPYPWPEERVTPVYGFQTMFDERSCQSKTKRHAMCESSDPKCHFQEETPFTVSEKKTDYLEDGNWVFSNSRKYVVNWKQRNYNETVEYCKSISTYVLNPNGGDEKYLIPHLKMWTRGITNSLFWTNLTYDSGTGVFTDPTGKVISNKTINFSEEDFLKSIRRSKKFCVALSYTYEMMSQMACPYTERKKCNYAHIKYVPSNCKNFHGAVCQHPDFKSRTAFFSPTSASNMTSQMQGNLLMNLLGTNYDLFRSTVKQTFGNVFCRKGYRLLRKYNLKRLWNATKISEKHRKESYYDFLATYWVLDEEGFNKTDSSNCTVTYVENNNIYERKFKQVSCTEWHFYICETTEGAATRKTPGNFSISKPMQWNTEPQPRLYPVIT